jgi:hypothetical protein
MRKILTSPKRCPDTKLEFFRILLNSSIATATRGDPSKIDLAGGIDSESGRRLELLGYRVEEAAIESGIEGHTELAMIIVTEGDKAERLETGGWDFARRVKHFGHSVDGAGPGVKGDFDKVSAREFAL